jgi:hypothetical protein
MKAHLIFNLPEDQHEFELANNASKMYNVLWKMDQYLRTNTKYAPDAMSEDTYNTFQQCREQLREFMNEDAINFDH